jgi:hypothetical protein
MEYDQGDGSKACIRLQLTTKHSFQSSNFEWNSERKISIYWVESCIQLGTIPTVLNNSKHNNISNYVTYIGFLHVKICLIKWQGRERISPTWSFTYKISAMPRRTYFSLNWDILQPTPYKEDPKVTDNIITYNPTSTIQQNCQEGEIQSLTKFHIL